MKNLIYTIFITLAIVYLSSCFPKPLEINLGVYEPRLVISSQVNSDTGMYVTVTRSFSALNDNYKFDKINMDFINRVFSFNSLVLVEHHGKTDTLKLIGPGLYFNPYIPIDDFYVYDLYVFDSTTTLSVTSSTMAYPAVDFDTIIPEIIIEPEDTTAVVYYTFTDLPGYNHYMVNYYKDDNDSTIQGILNFDPEDPLIQELLDSLGYYELYKLLARMLAIGTDLETTVLIEETDLYGSEYADSAVFYNVNTWDTLVLSVANISPEYFNYLFLRERAGSLYSQIMGEPINMPTNIDTGYGMFTAHKQIFRFLYLSEYEFK